MDIQKLVDLILENEDVKRAAIAALLKEKQEKDAAPVYVWCEKATTVDGENYYHPVVTFMQEDMFSIPASDEMVKAENYKMFCSENQFEAYRMEDYIEPIRAVTNREIKLIAVPHDVFERLNENLMSFLWKIFEKVEKVFIDIDKLAENSFLDVEALKQRFCMDVLNQINRKSLYSCLSENMTIEDGGAHEYIDPDIDEDDEEEYGEDYCLEEDCCEGGCPEEECFEDE